MCICALAQCVQSQELHRTIGIMYLFILYAYAKLIGHLCGFSLIWRDHFSISFAFHFVNGMCVLVSAHCTFIKIMSFWVDWPTINVVVVVMIISWLISLRIGIEFVKEIRHFSIHFSFFFFSMQFCPCSKQ